MAIEFAGTQLSVNVTSTNFSTSITIPSDAILTLIGLHWYSGSTYGTTVSVGGIASTEIIKGTQNGYCAAAYRILTSESGTGSKTLAITLDAYGHGPKANVVFVKGVDTSTPVRDSYYQRAANTTVTSEAFSCEANDLCLLFAGAFSPVVVDPVASGQTTLISSSTYNNVSSAVGYKVASAGTSTTMVFTLYPYNDAMLVALSLIPSAATATALPRRALDGPFYGSLRGSVQ